MKSIIFIAPPAAGKGTQSSLIADKYSIPHISMGDILRACSDDTKIGKYIKETLSKGELVDGKIAIDLLKSRLTQPDCKNGYVLDGFPRNKEQAINFEKMLKSINMNLGVVIVLDIDEETALKRTIHRRICPNCHEVYNDAFDDSKAKIKGICDECGNKLIKRTDDNEETFKNRYKVYYNETEPLINYYEARGLVKHVNSGIDINYTFNKIANILEEIK